MDGIHSYEQRSSSEISRDLYDRQNRIIIVDRHEPNAKWSTSNQPIQSRAFSWFNAIRRKFSRAPGLNDPNRSKLAGYSISSISTASYDFGPFPSNELCTSKYTLVNFLPKNLFEQFRRMANFYFLATAVLQIIIPFSPVGPTTSLLPLMFVVATTSIKQAYEDYLRHRLDKEVNNRSCQVLRNKKLTRIRSKDIRVGDFVHVRNNEEVPCDMLLLASSNSCGDKCYVTTANLDGETSLKSRTCYQIKEQVGSVERLDDTLLVIECERPNATLYEFSGSLHIPKAEKSYQALVNDLGRGVRGKEGNQTYNSIAQTILDRIKYSKARKSIQRLQTDTILNSLTDYYEIPLDVSNLLLRASRLRNTDHIYGLAIYTGSDTKLACNSHVKANKFSSSESKVNMFLLIAFLTLLLFSLIGSLMYRRPNAWFYSGLEKSDSFGQIFLAHFLLYNYLVPISLYVTLEFVKFFGTTSVVGDEKMRAVVWKSVANSNEQTAAIGGKQPKSLTSINSSRKTKTLEGPKCNSSDLNEDLGQVEVLFSDKTGTLTENKMRFMACSAYGQLYRSLGDQLYLQAEETQTVPIEDVAQKLARVGTNRYALLNPTNSTFSNGSNQSDGSKRLSPDEANSNSRRIKRRHFDHRLAPGREKLKPTRNLEDHESMVEFFICLCLCSTITLNETLPLSDCLPDKTQNDYNFQTASPDEESLISASNRFGVTLCKSNDQECFIAIRQNSYSKSLGRKGKQKGEFKPLIRTRNSTEKFVVRHFQRLLVFEFNSVRKRMSVIYKDCDSNCILMVTKGSEELLDCIRLRDLDKGEERCVNVTLAYFEAFAKSGLRTLLVARRILEEEEFGDIMNGMKEARLSISNREYLMESVYRQAEHHLKLIGATAVEDTLQERVPETVANLKAAGVKVWLLTGDKVETAVSVAYLCRLLDREMTVFNLVRQQDVQACQKLLLLYNQQVEAITKGLIPLEKRKSKSPKSQTKSQHRFAESTGNGRKFALVADGRSLYYAMKYAKSELSQLCRSCTCVLGCRLSPLQKAEVVDMVKSGEEQPITAAIGDGANDVSMIQEAHVGIGVDGKEGKQAVNSSDFAIHRFYMLNRLLFVHGHQFYHRTANTIHYFFYKNMIFILPQFLYSFYNLSSAQTLYHPVFLICYNLFFTSLPILIYGLNEIHIPEEMLENYPRLYRINKCNRQMRFSVFFSWLSIGALQATIAFYLLLYNWGSHTPILESGKMLGLNGFSMVLYFVIVITVTLKLYFLSNSHTRQFNVSVLTSIVLMPLLLTAYSLMDWNFLIEDNTLYGQVLVCLKSPMFWIAVGSTTAATLLPNIFLHLIIRFYTIRGLNRLIFQAGDNSIGYG